jgi:hypothetical protein
MTLRHAVLGLGVVFGLSVWAVCRPCDKQAQIADPIYEANVEGTCTGGNHEDAAYRFRTNQSTHWRQVALGR